MDCIMQAGCKSLENIEFFSTETNGAWCRDHSPGFLINKMVTNQEKAIVNWGYNAWEIISSV